LLVTPDRLVLDTVADEVYAPGSLGQFGVLPLHTDFLTSLETGELRFRENGVDRYVAVGGGVAEVYADTVTVLADTAELASEIDVERAREAAERARRALSSAEPGSFEAADAEASLRRAENRQAVAQRAGK
jgi:F-type H+-transporting ATPase subunit epsilon